MDLNITLEKQRTDLPDVPIIVLFSECSEKLKGSWIKPSGVDLTMIV
jgi:hypothetical protein